MRNRFTYAFIAIMLGTAATLTGTAQQPARQGGAAAPGRGRGASRAARPDRIAGHPNLNGIWQAINSANWNLEDHAASATAFWQLGAMFAISPGQSVIVDNNGTIPYTSEGLKKRQENRAGWPKSDPEAKCYMPGLPRATYMPYPFQIVQGENDILFMYEYAGANRTVHMTSHTESPVDSWMGWSNGKWDGDTLVIETIGVHDWTRLDTVGHPHSEKLRLVTTYRRTDFDHLTFTVTVDDPETYTKPWTNERTFTRSNGELIEYSCEENNKDLREGHIKFWTPPPPKKKP